MVLGILSVVFSSLMHLAFLAAYQTAAPASLVQLKLDHFEDIYAESTPTFGRRLVGFGYLNVDTSLERHQVAADARGRDADGPLCITLTGRDGRWRGEGETLAAPVAQLLLSFEPRYPEKLSQYGTRDLAVLARAGACQTQMARPLIPAGFENKLDDAPIAVWVNARQERAAARLLDIQDSVLADAKCREVGDRARRAFNTICVFDQVLPNEAVSLELGFRSRISPRESVERYPLAWPKAP